MRVLCVIPSSALTLLPYKDCFAEVANDAGVKYNLDGEYYSGPNNTYYMKFDGGGLNTLHITTNTGSPNRQPANSTSATGTFYVSDTGGRGYDDDTILMFATNASLSSDFSIEINAGGGMAQVDYEIGNFTGFGAFDAYVWCLDSNQGQRISWTNQVSGTGSSGYTVNIS